MKKSLLIVPLALAMFSCANDKELATPDQGTQSGEVETQYLSVNIMGLTGGTRAGEVFEDGSDKEYAVKKVIFYFFKDGESGSYPVAPVVGGTDYYFEPTGVGVEPDGTTSDDIEANVNAMIVLTTAKTPADGIYGEDNQQAVNYIVAVLNPSDAFLNASKSINSYSELLALTDEDTDLYETGKTNFVMSNAVYLDAAGNQNNGLTKIETSNICSTPSAALANPVTIYVEREAAKATVDVSESYEDTQTVSGDKTIYKIIGGENSVGEKNELYVDILGWNVTATASGSYVLKNLNSSWTASGTTPFTAWNDATTNHRSYWGVNPAKIGNDNLSYVYDTFTNDQVLGLGDAAYFTENAYVKGDNTKLNPTDDETATPTKIIVAAQIVDKNGNAVPIVEYRGAKYTYEDEATLEKTVLRQMAENSGIYIRVSSQEGVVKAEVRLNYNEALAQQFLKLVSNQNLDDVTLPEKVADRNYYTYGQFNKETYPGSLNVSDGQLSEGALETILKSLNGYTYAEGDQISFTVGNGNGASVINSLTDFNQRFIDYVGFAKIWNEGRTYYYLNIKHVNTASPATEESVGYYGVIRNHWYETSVTAINGLGTPVFDPSDIVYPQTPEEDPYTYVAAEIKVLSWRKVAQDGTLGW